MSNSLISVIVPVYKVEKYLPKCVESIMGQSYKNLEIILVDDGSPDDCGKLCDEYAAKDSRVKVIHKKNGGLSDARNVALDVMAGDYVTFIDSDDYVANDFVESLYKLIFENGAEMSVVSLSPFYEGCGPEKESFGGHKTLLMDREFALAEMFYQKKFDTTAWAKMYKVSMFADVRYPKGWLFEDLATTYKLILKSEKIVFYGYKAYYYLLRKESIEGSAFKLAKYESCLNIVNQLEADRKKMPEKARKALNSRLVSFAFHVFIQIPKSNKKMRKTIFSFVRLNRHGVVFNSNARLKARFAAFFSYGGMSLIDLFAKYGVSRK